MSTSLLRAGSAACFVSAGLGALVLPSFMFTESQALQVAIPLVSLGLYGLYMLVLRKLLVEHLAFSRIDRLIVVLIAGHAAIAVSSVLDEVSAMLIPTSLVLVIGGCFTIGVSAFLFGIRLLSFRSRLGALGTAYAILQMGVGVSFATVYLIPVAIILSVFSDAALGVILAGYSGGRLFSLETSKCPPSLPA